MTTGSPVFAHHGMKVTQAPSLDEVKSWGATCDVRDAARALGIHPATAYEWIRLNLFPCQVISVRHRHRVVTASLVEVLSGEAA